MNKDRRGGVIAYGNGGPFSLPEDLLGRPSLQCVLLWCSSCISEELTVDSFSTLRVSKEVLWRVASVTSGLLTGIWGPHIALQGAQ